MKHALALSVLGMGFLLGSPAALGARPERPALVVLIAIDQFPAWVLERLEGRFAAAGFRRFMERGAWYADARYPQAATLTGVGHATISTGALPAEHGIAGNDWYDRSSDKTVYCVEDEAHHWIGAKEKPGEGTSPRKLTTTTFGDEWRLAAGPDARVIGISLKDRGSILLAGRLGKAFWYDERTGLFVSSTYYYPDGKLPGWVTEFNGARHPDRLLGAAWDLLLPVETYTAAADSREYEIDVKGLGRTFPHAIGKGLEKPGPDLWKQVLTVPQGNQLILDLALDAVRSEKLGQRGVTDMLLLSLTANDYCGHHFGPESLEYEDITLRTDRQVEAFMEEIERQVGRDRSLFVLTSDHGATPSPEHLAALGMPVGRIDPADLAKAADDALDAAFGPAEWTAKFLNPGLFLKAAPLRPVLEKGAEQIAAEAVRRVPGVAAAFARGDIAAGRLPDTPIARSVRATFHPERSPDVVIIQEPYWYLYKNVKEYEGMHGSPYACDAHVPIIFLGGGIPAGRHMRRVSPADIAPTISSILGMTPPASSTGSVLEEALPRAESRTQGLQVWSVDSPPPVLDDAGRQVFMTVTAAHAGASPPLAAPRLSPIGEGGWSGLAPVRSAAGGFAREPFEFWTITDRGPNMAIEKRAGPGGEAYGPGAKYFPHPAYNQAILRLRLEPGGRLRIVERLPLRQGGRPTNGLPSSAAGREGNETAYSSLEGGPGSAVIPPSDRGHDFEGIHEDAASDGSRRFWTCDEYGPSLQVFDGKGDLLSEFIPGAAPGGAGNGPAVKPLPAVLRHRKHNRGFEGLAGTSRFVFAMVQSPLDPEGGASGEEGHGNPATRIHRIVRLDKDTHETAMFAYDHIADPEAHGTVHGEVKIGDIAALDDPGRELLVYEHSGKLLARVYRMALEEAAVLSEKEGAGYEAGKVPYTPVRKELVLDLTAKLRTLPVPDKGEGLALLDARTIAILFDNDCGFGTDDVEVFELPGEVTRSVLVTVELEP